MFFSSTEHSSARRKYGIVHTSHELFTHLVNFDAYATQHSHLRHGWSFDRFRTLLARGRHGNTAPIRCYTLSNPVSSYDRPSYALEWLDYWFGYFGIDKNLIPAATAALHANVFEKIRTSAEPLPGVHQVLDFFRRKNFRIGLATSSPLSLAKIVTDKLNIGDFFDVVSSAGDLPFGKPHPQVYMNCATELSSNPLECLAFEDSFNGMIAAKAARMKCVVIPVHDQYAFPKWGAADLQA